MIRLSVTAVAFAYTLTSRLTVAQLPQEGITPPAVLARRDAEYPETARASGQQGVVVLDVTVGRDGSVQNAVIHQSAGAALDEAAQLAVRTWSFAPARTAGEAVASRIRISFRFALPSAPAPNSSEVAVAKDSGASGTEDARTQTKATSQTQCATDVQATCVASSPVRPVSATSSDRSEGDLDVEVRGTPRAPRSGSDLTIEVGRLGLLPLQNATDVASLAPGLVATNEGGAEFGQHLFLRGFSADEGQDFEMSVHGVPINESGNLDVNGFADPHFILPELVQSVHVVEGTFDPRQSNYAAAASVNYRLGLDRRGLLARYTAGSWHTERLLVLWGPKSETTHTFAGAEIYRTNGFGQNRDVQRATTIAQYEGRLGERGSYRLTAQAYHAQFHSAGELREDDVAAGRIGFFDTYDPRQGGESSRYSIAATIEKQADGLSLRQQIFLIRREMELRENFTGFVEDLQEPWQSEHEQRGDLVDTHSNATTFGARGLARGSLTGLGEPQTLEIGYFLRGDFVNGDIRRLAAGTSDPYRTDGSLSSRLGDFGVYSDVSLRLGRWVSVRGGPRLELLTFDVLDRCAVPNASEIPATLWPNDASCLAIDSAGNPRNPAQRTTAAALAVLPRASLALGPLRGFSATLSYGTGGRSLDPQSVADGVRPLFATVQSYEGAIAFTRVQHGWHTDARSVFFDTYVSQDTLFSESVGRTLPTQATNRTGWAGVLRLTGPFIDELASVTLARAIYGDTGVPVPFTPTSVLRSHTMAFGRVARARGREISWSAGGVVTYVGPRPLPYGEHSSALFHGRPERVPWMDSSRDRSRRDQRPRRSLRTRRV